VENHFHLYFFSTLHFAYNLLRQDYRICRIYRIYRIFDFIILLILIIL